MAKSYVALPLVLLLASFAYMIAFPSAHAVDPIRVYVDPSSIEDQTLVVNSVFPIYVRVDNVPTTANLVGIQFKLSWTPGILNVTAFTDNIYANLTPEEEQDNIWMLSKKTNNTGGYVDYSYTWLSITQAVDNGYAPISGNHIIANITMKVAGIGETDLHFAVSKLGAQNASSIAHTVEDGYFSNQAPLPPQQPGHLYVSPAEVKNASLVTGQNFTVSVRVNATDLGGLEFKFGFNSSVLNVNSAVRGSFIPVSVTPDVQIDNVAGFVKFNASLSSPLTGDGAVAEIELNVMMDDVRDSILSLYEVTLIDGSGEILSHTTANGKFSNVKIEYSVTFTQIGLDSTASGTIVTVNGSPKAYADLPFTVLSAPDDGFNYSYSSKIYTASPAKWFILVEVIGPASPFTVTGDTTITGNYTLAGDLDGSGGVDILDAVRFANIAFGASEGDPDWNSAANLAPAAPGEEETIDIFDLILLVRSFGQSLL